MKKTLLYFAALAAAAASAQEAPSPTRPPQVTELRRMVERLARRTGSEIYVDHAVRLTRLPRPPGSDLPLAKALDVITAQAPGLTWRRVHVAPDAAPEKDLERWAAAARLAETLPRMQLVVEQDSGRDSRRTILLRDRAVSSLLAAEPVRRRTGKAVYLLYSL